jgi:hypothetical protein
MRPALIGVLLADPAARAAFNPCITTTSGLSGFAPPISELQRPSARELTLHLVHYFQCFLRKP